MGALAIWVMKKAGAYFDGSVHVSDGVPLALLAGFF